MAFNLRDQLVLVKVEPTKGTDAVPTPAANALEAGNLAFSPNLNFDDGTAQHTGSLDAAPPVVLGGGGQMTFFTRLRGSGTQGTAPRAGQALRACGLSETVLGAAKTGTAQGAGGGNNTLQLAVGAITADGLHVGQPLELTGGAGSGEKGVIISSTAADDTVVVDRDWVATLGATTQYSIPANVTYSPISIGQEAATVYGYQNANESGVQSKLRKVLGAMGNAVFTLGPRALPQVAFTFQGLFAAPSEVTRPTGQVFDVPVSPAYISARATLGGKPVGFSELSIDLGNTLAQEDDPAAAFGVGVAAITGRRITAAIAPYVVANSAHDFWADLQSQTARHMVQQWGATDGNKITMTMPSLKYDQNPSEGDQAGLAQTGLRAHATGADSGFHLCFH